MAKIQDFLDRTLSSKSKEELVTSIESLLLEYDPDSPAEFEEVIKSGGRLLAESLEKVIEPLTKSLNENPFLGDIDLTKNFLEMFVKEKDAIKFFNYLKTTTNFSNNFNTQLVDFSSLFSEEISNEVKTELVEEVVKVVEDQVKPVIEEVVSKLDTPSVTPTEEPKVEQTIEEVIIPESSDSGSSESTNFNKGIQMKLNFCPCCGENLSSYTEVINTPVVVDTPVEPTVIPNEPTNMADEQNTPNPEESATVAESTPSEAPIEAKTEEVAEVTPTVVEKITEVVKEKLVEEINQVIPEVVKEATEEVTDEVIEDTDESSDGDSEESDYEDDDSDESDDEETDEVTDKDVIDNFSNKNQTNEVPTYGSFMQRMMFSVKS